MAAQKLFSKAVITFIFLLLLLAILAFWSRPDGKLHLVFCDVGQGDAILVITPQGDQVLIDGGPNNKVLNCLGAKMPFWDRQIEMVILTHPQADHMVGLIEVLKRYQVEKIVANNVSNSTPEYYAWQERIKAERAEEIRVKRGELINFGQGLKAQIEWPIDGSYPQGFPAELNESSIVLRFEYADFCGLMTGDAPNAVLEVMSLLAVERSCTVLKVPHHGSKNSLYGQFWDQVKPQIAVVSSGENNRYGHPHLEVLEKLAELNAKVLRTDQLGMIEIVSDGEKVQLR